MTNFVPNDKFANRFELVGKLIIGQKIVKYYVSTTHLSTYSVKNGKVYDL